MKQLKFIREFTPNWFAVSMGTGGTALVLGHFVTVLPFLFEVAACLWGINIILFILFSVLFITRFIFYPHHFMLMLRHPLQPLFLGCIPMGLITIVNGFNLFGIPLIGEQPAIAIASVLWWIDVFLALFFSWLVSLAMFLLQEHRPETMTPVWLLPFVACEVAAASGGTLIPHFAESIRSTSFILCLILWAISIFLAFGILAIFFKRLVIHSLPDKALAPSIWLVLGPIGTGALGLMTLAQASQSLQSPVFDSLHTMTQIFPGLALFGAILLWGFGLWWLIIACLGSLYHWIKGIQFGLSSWAFTFPLAVYTLGTFALEQQTQCFLFTLCGIACSVLLVCFWLIVSVLTLRGACNQTLFSAPCLSEVNNKK